METEEKYRVAPPGFTAEQWKTFNEDGIIFIEDAISDADIQTYIDTIDRVSATSSKYTPGSYLGMENIVERDPVFTDLIDHERHVGYAYDLFGELLKLHQSQFFLRPPGGPPGGKQYNQWHPDGARALPYGVFSPELPLQIKNSENRYGIETMMNDIGNPTIFGGRGFYRPFQREENNNLLTRFELGATYLTDINPNLQEAGEDPLSAVGLDVGFPIFETSTFRLDLYDDIAFLNTLPEENDDSQVGIILREENSVTTNLAWGNAVGVGFSFTQTLFKVEYRTFGEGYIPSVFDYTYESAKSLSPEPGMPQFFGLETNTEPRRGFFSQLIWHPLPQIHFMGTFDDYTNTQPKLYMAVTESGLVPRLSLRAFYTKRDIGEGGETNFFGDLFDLDEKSAFSVEVRYEVFPPVVTIVTREYRFRRVETADGISQFEPIHKTSFMVGVSTDF